MQPQQHFCTNCGQSVAPGTAFCVVCGTPVNTPLPGAAGQFPVGAQPGSSPSSMPPMQQVPAQAQDDPLLAGLVAASAASQVRRRRLQRARRPASGLRGFGCFLLVLLILALLAAPFIGLALTTGQLHQILTYVAAGLVILFLLVVVIAMLATKSGREFLFEAVLDGLFNGG